MRLNKKIFGLVYNKCSLVDFVLLCFYDFYFTSHFCFVRLCFVFFCLQRSPSSSSCSTLRPDLPFLPTQSHSESTSLSTNVGLTDPRSGYSFSSPRHPSSLLKVPQRTFYLEFDSDWEFWVLLSYEPKSEILTKRNTSSFVLCIFDIICSLDF